MEVRQDEKILDTFRKACGKRLKLHIRSRTSGAGKELRLDE